MVTSDAGEIGQKEIRTEWPVEEGLTAGTTKQTGERFLNPTKGSKVPDSEKVLL